MSIATSHIDKEILAPGFVETVKTNSFKRKSISPAKLLRSAEETLHGNIEVSRSGGLLDQPVWVCILVRSASVLQQPDITATR